MGRHKLCSYDKRTIASILIRVRIIARGIFPPDETKPFAMLSAEQQMLIIHLATSQDSAAAMGLQAVARLVASFPSNVAPTALAAIFSFKHLATIPQ